MRTIVAITHVTLDGVMQSPAPDEDPSGGFTHGGWTVAYRDQVKGQAIRASVAGAFDLLLGRRTYDHFASFWPSQVDDPIGKAFNKATKYVVTRHSGGLGWERSQRIGGDVVSEVRALKTSDGPDLQIWGSSQLLQTLIGAGLVDEYRMMIYPVVLGEGKRLFGNGVPPQALALIETQRTPTGVVINTYRSAGAAG